MSVPSYREEISSQLPALQLLMNMGWQYLRPAEADQLRNGKRGRVILMDVLRKWLHEHNYITFHGENYDFSDNNIEAAINLLLDESYNGLIHTNETLYLICGTFSKG